jgi:hypothetical protein
VTFATIVPEPTERGRATWTARRRNVAPDEDG